MPLISVITPTYNRRPAVLRAVRSVLDQTLGDFEHIVVDDGSTDGTADALREIGDPRVTVVVAPKRQGANVARNLGIEAARSDLLSFLDSDDVYLPHRLDKAVRSFDADPELDLMISSFETIRGDKRTRSANREGFVDAATLEKALVMQVIYIAGSAITVRRRPLLEAGSFDPDIPRLQDREVLLRLARRNGALFAQEVDWLKYTSPDSISGHPEGYIEAYELLMRKHPRLRQAYASTVRSTVARHLLKALTKGRFGDAAKDFRFNRDAEGLGYSVPDLVRGMMAANKERHQLRDRLRAGGGE